jgi:protein-L-isoaspartate(D-aspartate) O-methyltransferase
MRLRTDGLKFQGMRRQLVKKVAALLEEAGLYDEGVLNAMLNVPRHYFFDSTFDMKYAYDNAAFPIGAGQTISQPYTVAFQTALLNIQKRDKILEIGTGSGYQCAILCEMGAKVFSIERQKLLYESSQKILDHMGYRPRLFYGDGYKGKTAFAPFDKMIVTCGAPYIPDALKEQLKIGGILIIPVGSGNEQRMLRITRVSEDEYHEEDFGLFSFVPMLEDTNR